MEPRGNKGGEIFVTFLLKRLFNIDPIPNCNLDESQGCPTHADWPVFPTMLPIKTIPGHIGESAVSFLCPSKDQARQQPAARKKSSHIYSWQLLATSGLQTEHQGLGAGLMLLPADFIEMAV